MPISGETMSGTIVSRVVMPGAVVLLAVTGVFASTPAQADQTSYSSWASREDATVPTASTTYTADTGLQLGGGYTVSGTTAQGQELSATFRPADGDHMEAGRTYQFVDSQPVNADTYDAPRLF